VGPGIAVTGAPLGIGFGFGCHHFRARVRPPERASHGHAPTGRDPWYLVRCGSVIRLTLSIDSDYRTGHTNSEFGFQPQFHLPYSYRPRQDPSLQHRYPIIFSLALWYKIHLIPNIPKPPLRFPSQSTVSRLALFQSPLPVEFLFPVIP
jgi:hypothetical protein